jgi:hypothetical protein
MENESIFTISFSEEKESSIKIISFGREYVITASPSHPDQIQISIDHGSITQTQRFPGESGFWFPVASVEGSTPYKG